MTPWASRMKNAVASTSTRSASAASTLKPHSTDEANESATARRSAAIRAQRAEPIVGLNQQHAGADPHERHDRARADLPAVESQAVRAHAGRQRHLVEKLLVEPPDLEQQLALGLVPIDRHEPFHPDKFRRSLRDSRDDRRLSPGRYRRQQHAPQSHHA